MGNHGAASARARAGTASNRDGKSIDVDSRSLRPLSLSNWSVSRRLFAVIVMALLMGLVFGGLRVASAESSAAQFGRASQLADLGEQLTGLIQALQNERDVTAVVITSGDSRPLGPLFAATDRAVAQVRPLLAGIGSGFPANIQADASAVAAEVSPAGIAALHQAYTSSQDVLAIIASYGADISSMISLNDQIAQGVSDAALANDVRALNALSLAKEEASQERAILYNTFTNRQFALPGLPTVLNNAFAEEVSDDAAFRASATPAEASLFDTELGGQDVSRAEQIEDYVLGNIQPAQGANGYQPANGLPTVNTSNGFSQVLGSSPSIELTEQNTPARWYGYQSAKINAMQAVAQDIAGNIAARARSLESGAQQSALITIVITVVILFLVLVAALAVARSLVLPLRRLRAGALHIASVQLPERVRRLSEAPDSAAALQVEPIDVLTEDEIGQVARAFDQVHQEAVRLAGEEALLRTSFNAMFVNLSRRSQSLIERLARMIDSLEQNEEDPDRLSSLFGMDHLVTRMRRNSENLLLLAGHESARKWSEPVPLADVARAAVSEIEQYARVALSVQPGVMVSGQAASDVVHLLAEIIENATIYSPKDTQVRVSAQELTSGGVLIEIRDGGVGISDARLAEINRRLDDPPVIDESVSRHMGLFAVARLAERHGVRVRLRAGSPEGLTALVWLPDTITERGSRPYGARPRSLAVEAGFRPGAAAGRYGPAAGWAADGAGGNDQPGAVRDADGAGGTHEVRAAGSAMRGEPDMGGWFRSRRWSAAGTAGGLPAAGTAGGLPAAGGGLAATDAWAENRRAAQIIADPVRGDLTAAGLPMRVPQANLIPGSVGGRHAADDADRPAAGRQAQAPGPQRPRPSAELARSRLSGFQRGARRAKGQAPRTGQGADR